MRNVLLLLKKDIQQERNSGELVIISLTLCLLLGTLTAFGVREAVLTPQAVDRIFPTLVWLIFLFSGMLVIVRISDADYRDSAYQALLLSGVSSVELYLSKVIFGGILLLFLHLLNFTLLFGLIEPRYPAHFGWFTAISVVIVSCFVSLSVLISAVAETSRLRGILFPILLLPVLFPVFFGAISVTQQLYLDQNLSFSSFWVQALPALMLVYAGLGVSLYEHVVLE